MGSVFVGIGVALLSSMAGLWLIFDACKRRRIERQLFAVLPAVDAGPQPLSLRRAQVRTKWRFLRRLVNYDPGIVYTIRPTYILLIATAASLAISYVGITILGFGPSSVALAAAAAGLLVMRSLLGWQQRRFANRLFQQLPDVVELITSTVKAGLPVAEAFRVVARDMPQPTAGQFELVLKELALGSQPEDALYGVYHRTHVDEYSMFAVTVAVQTKSGGSLAETLKILGDTVRQRVGLASRAKALAGEVIFTARALTCAPFIVGGMLYLINPRMIILLFTDHTGQMMLAYAVTSVIVGSLVIRWMIRRETTL
jgi:tight adherence protein B